jgi:hypothetical protein
MRLWHKAIHCHVASRRGEGDNHPIHFLGKNNLTSEAGANSREQYVQYWKRDQECVSSCLFTATNCFGDGGAEEVGISEHQ